MPKEGFYGGGMSKGGIPKEGNIKRVIPKPKGGILGGSQGEHGDAKELPRGGVTSKGGIIRV